ncbi:MAG: DNA polymerase III subunit beta [Aliarcobacter sp.]
MFSVTCSQRELHNAVKLVARGVSRRSVTPIQNSIMLEVKPGPTGTDHRLYLTASDLEYIGIATSIDIEYGTEGGVVIPPAILDETIGKLATDEVTLTALEDNTVAIEGGKYKSEVWCLSADDYETLGRIENPVHFEMSQADLLSILRQTLFAASTDETRPILTGLLFEFRGSRLTVASTDTYRLCLRKYDFDTEVAEELDAIISRTVLAEVMRLLKANGKEPVEVSLGDNEVEFTIGDVTLGSRTIEGQFVNYPKVVPTEYTKKACVDAAAFSGALKRAVPIAKYDANRVVLDFTGDALLITAKSHDFGTCEETIEGVELEGEPLKTALNSHFMEDMLGVCGTDTVDVEMSEPLNSIVFRPVDDDEYLYVLMPMAVM